MTLRVSIRDIIKTKNYKLYKKLPSFVFSVLERILHQDDVNALLEGQGHMQGVDFIKGSLDSLGIKRTFIGIDELNKNETYIFASNHPLGGLDAFAISEAVSHIGDVRLVVNDILMNLTPLKSIFLPVNKHGTQNKESVASFNETIANNYNIIYFPAGLCSRKINGKITDSKWKKTFVQKAIESNKPIVPVYVDNINSQFFYNIAYIRKLLRIKVNIEMLLLPGELFKKKNKDNIRVYFGDPIPPESLKNKDMSILQWVDVIRDKCYNLKK